MLDWTSYILKILRVLPFLYINLSIAESISDFQIEGISIGDSILDHFTSYQINQGKRDWYKNKTFTPVVIKNSSLFEVYDEVQINYLTSDNSYSVKSVSGTQFMSYDSCLKKLDVMTEDFNNMISDGTFYEKDSYAANFDNSTEITDVYWEMKSGSIIIQCYDMDSGGELSVAIDTIDFFNFLSDNPY